ncbi:MAG: hypothetical protein ABI779_18820 [Acidobacteriota bacterium]
MNDVPDDPRERFEHFSNEYAQALQAYQTIETQAGALLLMGHHDELRRFIAQFLEMAGRMRELALAHQEANFADWFGELVTKGEALSRTV